MLNGRQRHFSSFFFQRKRLEGRGTETKESLQKRLDSAQEALEYGRVLFSVFQFFLKNCFINFDQLAW